jgi:hypothetical protein
VLKPCAQERAHRKNTLEKRGLYERQTGRNRPWTDREVRVLRRDYGWIMRLSARRPTI